MGIPIEWLNPELRDAIRHLQRTGDVRHNRDGTTTYTRRPEPATTAAPKAKRPRRRRKA